MLLLDVKHWQSVVCGRDAHVITD